MKTHYGNSFNHGSKDYSVGSVSLWARVDEIMPCGAFVPVDSTNTVGKLIPAGTAVSIDKIGGTTTLGGEAPQGLTLEDAYVGADGCSLTVVTRGQINESLSTLTYTAKQKSALAGRILFVKEG